MTAAARMYCETCDDFETDPIMLDTETCSRCGGLLTGNDADDAAGDGEKW